MTYTILLTLLTICVIVFVACVKSIANDQEKINKQIEKLNDKMSSLGAVKSHINNYMHGISFNEDKKEITFFRDEIRSVNYKDILQVEIVEDQESISKVGRKSQLSGALVGSLLLGGTGAIIGGLSGRKNHVEQVKEISLRLVVNDTSSPVEEFSMYMWDNYTSKKTHVYKNAHQITYEWYKLIEVLIYQADKDDEILKAQ